MQKKLWQDLNDRLEKQRIQLDLSLYQEISEIEVSQWKGGALSLHEVGHAHGRAHSELQKQWLPSNFKVENPGLPSG